jgi:hypothetical protein
LHAVDVNFTVATPMMTRSVIKRLALALAMASCTPAQHSAPSTASDTITRADLDAAGTATVYDVVARMRPAYLRSRGPTSVVNATARSAAVVFVNDAEFGDRESLRRFPASRIEEVRYYSGPEATTKFGSAYGAGVIALKTRSR